MKDLIEKLEQIKGFYNDQHDYGIAESIELITEHLKGKVIVSEKFINSLYDDLLMRGSKDNEGIVVVELSSFLWRQLNDYKDLSAISEGDK